MADLQAQIDTEKQKVISESIVHYLCVTLSVFLYPQRHHGAPCGCIIPPLLYANQSPQRDRISDNSNMLPFWPSLSFSSDEKCLTLSLSFLIAERHISIQGPKY